MQSSETTVAGYLASLPDDRRAAITTVRDVILAHLPKGYEETMLWGSIVYRVPESVYLDKGKPLAYVGLASQKQYMALYLLTGCTSDGADEWFRREYLATGKPLNMGKGCVRFRKLEDLPLDLVAKAISHVPMDELVAKSKAARAK